MGTYPNRITTFLKIRLVRFFLIIIWATHKRLLPVSRNVWGRFSFPISINIYKFPENSLRILYDAIVGIVYIYKSMLCMMKTKSVSSSQIFLWLKYHHHRSWLDRNERGCEMRLVRGVINKMNSITSQSSSTLALIACYKKTPSSPPLSCFATWSWSSHPPRTQNLCTSAQIVLHAKLNKPCRKKNFTMCSNMHEWGCWWVIK